MSYDDHSHPPTKPFEARMRESFKTGSGAAHTEVAYTVHEYVLLAKLMLIEHRVRDFTAGDVVTLAGIMEQRDRQLRYAVIQAGGAE